MKVYQKDDPTPRELQGGYLVFAALFDIDEQVSKSMEALGPVYYESFSGMYNYSLYRAIYFIAMTNHISRVATLNLNGIGSVASFVGGGGFSGGGGGGD